MSDIIEINLEYGLLTVLCVVLLLWLLSFRRQQKKITHLEEDIQAQKQLIDTQMQDLTEQMMAQTALNEKLHYFEALDTSLKETLAEDFKQLIQFI